MKGIGLASAFRTMTIFPFPGNESDSPATAMYWFVPVALVLGSCVFGIAWLLAPVGTPFLTGALVVAVLAILTRAFHLDGLADMADGFGGGWTRERVLEIMKDSHIGAFGVITLCLTLAVKVAAVAYLCGSGDIGFLVLVPLFSRLLVVLQAVVNPYARPEGGTAGRLVVEASWKHLLVSLLWTGALLAAFGFIPWKVVAIVLGTGLAVTVYIAVVGRRRIGGVTGDLLGATVELSETLMFVAAVLVPLP
ncbi:MAG TPA: adenosylcobinamide-GDP ribazoletransferase [Sphaerochaeta sp.]|nr:adenosylcobinamide-GDP ribazoletransferase [Sphaerochaeta sp.]